MIISYRNLFDIWMKRVWTWPFWLMSFMTMFSPTDKNQLLRILPKLTLLQGIWISISILGILIQIYFLIKKENVNSLVLKIGMVIVCIVGIIIWIPGWLGNMENAVTSDMIQVCIRFVSLLRLSELIVLFGFKTDGLQTVFYILLSLSIVICFWGNLFLSNAMFSLCASEVIFRCFTSKMIKDSTMSVLELHD